VWWPTVGEGGGDYGVGKGEDGDGRVSRANERLLCVTNATRTCGCEGVRSGETVGVRGRGDVSAVLGIMG
jgi:hypothetical protein